MTAMFARCRDYDVTLTGLAMAETEMNQIADELTGIGLLS